ncbi:MAG TPA: SigE family RNA polymerase sigma factor [Candidatus Nanopelagicales bacterium]|nr:SigE family RNA polymerase sigma factor [Candidatus Nanopelagicales bacterium]
MRSQFDAFYVATFPRLLRQLTLMTLDGEQAQDALQEAYVRAWQRWERISAYDDPEAWVRTVAYRHCVSHWRRVLTARRAAPRIAVDEAVGPVASAEVVAVRRALADLSYEQRAVLVLHELCDLSVEEISATLRIPTGTVKSRLSRGRTALADLLRDEPDDEPPRAAPAVPPQPRPFVVKEVPDVLGT